MFLTFTPNSFLPHLHQPSQSVSILSFQLFRLHTSRIVLDPRFLSHPPHLCQLVLSVLALKFLAPEKTLIVYIYLIL